MLSSIKDPKIMSLIIATIVATNTITFFVTTHFVTTDSVTTSSVTTNMNNDCEVVKQQLQQDEEDFKRAMGIPTDLNENREGGLKITDKIR